MSQKKGRIYKITNKVTQSIYIGCTISSLNKRMKEHITRCKTTDCNTKLYNSMRKHGFENFEIELIEECDLNVLYQTEMRYIKEFNTFEKGLNTTIGGEGCLGYVHSEEIRKKISNKLKNGNSHKGKTYHELYGVNADIEKEKRKKSVKDSWEKMSDIEKETRVKNLQNAVHKKSKYGIETVLDIKNKLKNGYTVKKLKEIYPNIKEHFFYDVKNKKRWANI